MFHQSGEPEDVLRIAEVPSPVLAGDGVVVEVTCSPIQPADLAFIRGQYRIRPEFPQVAGLEGSGTVVSTAVERGFGVGTRVAFRCPGAWAERVLVPLSRLAEVPPGVPDLIACQFSLNPITAWALLAVAGCESGDWILLTAAASTVSNLVGAIARHRRVGVIGLVRGDAAAAQSRSAADHVFSTQDPDLLERVATATAGRMATALIDSVGGPTLPGLFGCLSQGGRIVAYGVQDREPAHVTNAMLIYSNLTWIGFGIDHWLSKSTPVEVSRIRNELWALIQSGVLSLPAAAVYDLDSIPEALVANSQGGREGKVILRPTGDRAGLPLSYISAVMGFM